MMIRCMRAGAREFLTKPFSSNVMAEALIRAWSRRPVDRVAKKETGRLFAFLGAKGGSGVTTVAINFAVSIAQETGKETLLIDLNLPLGDTALNLGISAQYSTVDALQNFNRLDSNFLSNLLTKHSSGLSVLAAPSHFTKFVSSSEAIDKLLTVARQEFAYVVIDMGSRLDLTGTALFADTSTIYLVTQAGIPELRNANRLITEFFTTGGPKLEIVINRHTSRSMGIDEVHITKALTRPVQWKIPGDYVTAKRTQNVATPLVLEDSPISRVIRQMAREASGTPAVADKKKKRFGSLFA
jgi:pilus assembly protein CpaE